MSDEYLKKTIIIIKIYIVKNFDRFFDKKIYIYLFLKLKIKMKIGMLADVVHTILSRMIFFSSEIKIEQL